jgi:hypothetical protein
MPTGAKFFEQRKGEGKALDRREKESAEHSTTKRGIKDCIVMENKMACIEQ